MSSRFWADDSSMVVGMIFNVMVAIPLILMVVQFARVKPEAQRRPARRPQEVWDAYQRTMQAAPAPPAAPIETHCRCCGSPRRA